MEPRLVKTDIGIGDDGKTYTTHSYKQRRRQGEQCVEEPLISLILTDEGEELHCESEDPLVFWNPKTRTKIRCYQS